MTNTFLRTLAAGFGITPLESGGFASWQRVTNLAKGIEEALGTPLMIAALYDRDYFCPEEISAVHIELAKHLKLAHIHERKEFENYLLVPNSLNRAIGRAVNERRARGEDVPSDIPEAAALLREITDALRDDVQSQIIARRTTYLRSTGRDLADITRETLAWFTPRWDDFVTRLALIPGKDVLGLGRFRARIQVLAGISLTDARIIDAMHKNDIPHDLVSLVHDLDAFRKATIEAGHQ